MQHGFPTGFADASEGKNCSEPKGFGSAEINSIRHQLQALTIHEEPYQDNQARPPSVEELESVGHTQGAKPPPLPKFAGIQPRNQALQLLVDGKIREGFVDNKGRIRVPQPAHFSIVSDDEKEEVEMREDNKSRGSANPFVPGAPSPFRASPTPVAPLPPPPPRIEGWSRGSRRRSPSPSTPTTKRPGWGHLASSPMTVQRTRLPAGPPPPSPPSVARLRLPAVGSWHRAEEVVEEVPCLARRVHGL